MQRIIASLLLLACVVGVVGCTALMSSLHDGPVTVDPSKRTWGSWLDDKTIESAIKINIKQADPAFRQARIKVVSFNAAVLLIGQVPTEVLKQQAGAIARNIQAVRQTYNELTVGPTAGLSVQSRDAWLTAKIKTNLIPAEDVSADRVAVNTEAGTVYLMGIVTPEAAQAAVEVAQNTQGVQKVVKIFEYIQ